MTPKISVIVPVYNPPENYLRECLDSICGQTLKDIEIILIDNAATGNNPQILQEYAQRDKRIKLFRFEENQGAAGAVNKGIELSTADYFQIVDSDDTLKPQACKVLYNIVLNNNVDMVIFNADYYDTQAKQNYPSHALRMLPQEYDQKIFSVHEKLHDIYRPTLQYWNKLYKKTTVTQNNNMLCQELYATLSDTLFTTKQIYFSSRICFVFQSLYQYNIGIGVCNKYKDINCPYWNAPFIMAEKFEQFIKDGKISDEFISIISSIIIKHFIQFYHWTPEINRKRYFQHMQKYFAKYNHNNIQFQHQKKIILHNSYETFKAKNFDSHKLYFLNMYVGNCHQERKHTSTRILNVFKQKISSKHVSYYLFGIKIFTHHLTKSKECHQIPKVSVIVPVYNPPEQYLRECLDSICNQTLKDIEIILVDNASTGNNPQILQEYAVRDNRIKLFRFEENQGFPGACNKGLEIATGEYIHFVDSDDYITPNAYELCCKRIEETQTDFIFLAFQNYDMNRQKIEGTYKYCFQRLTNKNIYTFNDIKECIFFKETQAWNKFYRSSFIKNNKNHFCPQLRRACPDALFSFTNYLNAQNMAQLDTPVYIYRRGVGDGVVGGLKKADCNYFNEIIIFEDKAYNLMKSKMKKKDYRFMEDIILQSLKYFLDMLHPKNKKSFYKMSQKFINSHKFFSINDQQQSSSAKKFYKDLKHLSFKEYTQQQPGQKIRRFLGLTLLKEKIKNGKKIKKWLLGLKKIKSAKYTKYKFLGITIWYKKKHKKTSSAQLSNTNTEYKVWIFIIKYQNSTKKFYWFRCKYLHLKSLDKLAEKLLIKFGYKNIIKQILLLQSCPFWDETYYISTYNYDASKTHLSPLEHYLKIGWIEEKNPSELFDGNSYYRRYAHIADTPMLSFLKNVTNNPLVNFLEYGRYNYYYPYTHNKFPAAQEDIDQYWQHRHTRNKSHKVIYSCITGNHDTPLKAFRYIDHDWDYVLFTDNQKLVDDKYYGIWEIRPLQIHLPENRRINRWHKIHPHILFPDYDISIYVDGNVNIISSYIFDKVKYYTKNLLVPNHCCRFCLYDEGKIAIRTKSDNPEVVRKQMEEIRAAGFPANYGLLENNLLYRKHNDPQIIQIMNDWWAFVGTKSIRDQCSFSFALYKSGYKPQDYLMPNTRMLINDFCVPFHNTGKK